MLITPASLHAQFTQAVDAAKTHLFPEFRDNPSVAVVADTSRLARIRDWLLFIARTVNASTYSPEDRAEFVRLSAEAETIYRPLMDELLLLLQHHRNLLANEEVLNLPSSFAKEAVGRFLTRIAARPMPVRVLDESSARGAYPVFSPQEYAKTHAEGYRQTVSDDRAIPLEWHPGASATQRNSRFGAKAESFEERVALRFSSVRQRPLFPTARFKRAMGDSYLAASMAKEQLARIERIGPERGRSNQLLLSVLPSIKTLREHNCGVHRGRFVHSHKGKILRRGIKIRPGAMVEVFETFRHLRSDAQTMTAIQEFERSRHAFATQCMVDGSHSIADAYAIADRVRARCEEVLAAANAKGRYLNEQETLDCIRMVSVDELDKILNEHERSAQS